MKHIVAMFPILESQKFVWLWMHNVWNTIFDSLGDVVKDIKLKTYQKYYVNLGSQKFCNSVIIAAEWCNTFRFFLCLNW